MQLNKKNFAIAAGLSSLFAFLLLVASFIIGKQKLFLALNFDGGAALDFLLKYFTHLGDGLIWIPVLLIVVFILKRKDTILLLISAFLLSTIFTQVIKRFVFPGSPRPIKAITDPDLIHTVTGVDVHSLNSLPSGHTGTVFCVYFIFCLLFRKPWWVTIGFIYAAIAGYSRIYLAQHFAADIAAGMLVGITSVWFAAKIQEYWRKKRAAVIKS